MTQGKSNREIFKDHNQKKQTEKIYKSLSPNCTFDEMKNKRDEFQEISETLREETRVRRKKRELKKLKDEIEQFEKDWEEMWNPHASLHDCSDFRHI